MRPSLLPAVLLLAACPDPDPPTFHDDVAPILDQRCMGCHVDGGIAPFAMDDYETVVEWAPLIKDATADRAMPPWLVTGDGSCGTFRHSEWLSDDEIETLGRWADKGTLQGEPAERHPREPLVLDANHTDHTPEFEPIRVGGPLTEFDEYRCFLVDPEVDTDRFITGYEVRPGNDAIVHHVIGNVVDPARSSWIGGKTNAEVMADLDAASERAGWPCYSQAGDGVRVESDAVAWAPGQGAVIFPEGLGVALKAGHQVVYQIHYNLADPDTVGETDATEIDLRLADTVERELEPVYIDYLLGTGQTLPGGEDAVDYSRAAQLQQMGIGGPVDVWAVMPHMHELGRQLVATAEQTSGDNCMADVRSWDFGWQRVYWYAEPVRLQPRDRWRITCTFDTTDRPEGVTPGWGTQNEMCLTVLYVTAAE